MKNIKKKYTLLIIIASITLATSCWDYRDINTRDITLASLLDRNELENEFVLMHEVADLTGKSSGVDIKYLKTHLLKGFGSTFEEARNYLEQTSSNPTFLGTAKVVIFGKYMGEYGIDSYINRIEGLTDYRKTILPCVSLVDFNRLTDKGIRTENSLGFIVEKLLKYQKAKGNAYIPTAGELFQLKNDPDIGYLLPCITVEEEDIKYFGHGIFRNNKMIGLLNEYDSSGISYLINRSFNRNKSITMDDHGKNFYSFIVSGEKRKIKTDYIDDRAIFYIDLDVEAKFKFQYYDENIYRQDIKDLEAELSYQIHKEVSKIVELAQVTYDCDFLNFKKYFKVHNYDVYKSQPWPYLFKHAKFNINVTTKITDFNLMDTEKEEFNEGHRGKSK